MCWKHPSGVGVAVRAAPVTAGSTAGFTPHTSAPPPAAASPASGGKVGYIPACVAC